MCLNGFKIDGMFYNISDIFNWSPPQLEHFGELYKLVYPGFFLLLLLVSLALSLLVKRFLHLSSINRIYSTLFLYLRMTTVSPLKIFR